MSNFKLCTCCGNVIVEDEYPEKLKPAAEILCFKCHFYYVYSYVDSVRSKEYAKKALDSEYRPKTKICNFCGNPIDKKDPYARKDSEDKTYCITCVVKKYGYGASRLMDLSSQLKEEKESPNMSPWEQRVKQIEIE